MGIFTEADWHPFAKPTAEVVKEARGGSAAEPWLEDGRLNEFVRSSDPTRRRLFIRDDRIPVSSL